MLVLLKKKEDDLTNEGDQKLNQHRKRNFEYHRGFLINSP